MKPTKGKDLINKTANELDLSEELVKDVIDFYYSTVAKKLESLEYPKLRRDIKGLKRLLESPYGEDFRKVIKYNLSKEMMDHKILGLEKCEKYYKELHEKRYSTLEK